MTAQRIEADLHHTPSEPTATHSNGSSHGKSRDFARRAKAMFSKFPSSLDTQMKSSPYATLGIAFTIGMGTGILLASRILRSVLVTAVSYAAIELGRTYLREAVGDAWAVGKK